MNWNLEVLAFVEEEKTTIESTQRETLKVSRVSTSKKLSPLTYSV